MTGHTSFDEGVDEGGGEGELARQEGRADPVPDAIWDEAAWHYDEQGLAALLLMIATTSLFNRLNAPTRHVAGSQNW